MPPKGKAGGSTSTSYLSQRYGPYNAFHRLHHRLGVFKLAGCRFNHVGLRVDAGPLAGCRELQIADSQGNQVGRNRDRHPGTRTRRSVQCRRAFRRSLRLPVRAACVPAPNRSLARRENLAAESMCALESPGTGCTGTDACVQPCVAVQATVCRPPPGSVEYVTRTFPAAPRSTRSGGAQDRVGGTDVKCSFAKRPARRHPRHRHGRSSGHACPGRVLHPARRRPMCRCP